MLQRKIDQMKLSGVHGRLLETHLPPGSFEPAASADGMPTIYVPREQLVETMRALRDTPALRFAFLADIVGVDYLPREPRFEVVYLLASLGSRRLWRNGEAAAREGARAGR